MNSTKIWFSSNIGDRERFYNILRVTNGVSLFLGDFVYVLLTKILFYVALGFYLSSSAVILLFLSRK